MLRSAREVAVDTEGDSLHHYPARLSLVQAGVRDGRVWLIDPLALGDLGPLGGVFSDPHVCLVLHAGDNDLIHLKQRYGFSFGGLFDTAIAARFLGGKALGLDTLLAQYLGVTLPPSRQKDDWSARPLTEAQVAYAAADVRHLIALKDRLGEELERVGRLAWVLEECAALAAQPPLGRVDNPNAYLGLKGARDLHPRDLAVLRELYALREQLALAADRPPFKVLSEDMLLGITHARPSDEEALARVPGVTPRVQRRWGSALLAAVARGRALDESEWPRLERRPRPVTTAAVSRRIERLRRWRASATERVALEPGVLLPNRLIAAIAEAGPRSTDELAAVGGVRRWRVDAFGREIVAVLGAS